VLERSEIGRVGLERSGSSLTEEQAMQVESASIVAAAREIDSGAVIAGIAILGAFTIAIVGIVSGMYAGVRSRREREETKRELAAYVAEGSLTPDQAERLICADDFAGGEGCGGKSRRHRREAREAARETSGSRQPASNS
jgi:hypothetical protein